MYMYIKKMFTHSVRKKQHFKNMKENQATNGPVEVNHSRHQGLFEAQNMGYNRFLSKGF